MSIRRLDAPAHTEQGGWFTREQCLFGVLIVTTLLAFVLCFLLIQPFIAVLAWALALAIVAHPLHRALVKRLGNADLAAGLAVGLVALVVVLPALFVVSALVAEVAVGIETVKDEGVRKAWLDNVNGSPVLRDIVDWVRDYEQIASAVQQAVGTITGFLAQVIRGSLWAMLQLLLVLFTLFFFFRDRSRALSCLRHLLPLSETETDEVFQRVSDTIHATVYGSLVVALIQGAMGGFMFWLLDLPTPIFWGVVMAFLAVIPNLGAFVVWIPAAIVLALQGDYGRAAILATWGAIAIGLIDNLLYPYLVGARMRLHTLLAFFAILGGLMLLGPSGVVVGPVIAAIALALIDVWRRRTSQGKAAEQGVTDGIDTRRRLAK